MGEKHLRFYFDPAASETLEFASNDCDARDEYDCDLS